MRDGAASGSRAQPARANLPRAWVVVGGLLLIAFFFRVWLLNDVPPGLHHDEVIIGQIAKDILGGQLGIYFTAGYGHEPLYHYLVAGMFGAIDANAFVLRLTSAFLAMLGLATTYVLVRRMFSPALAVGTLAWMAISLWPVFFARVGLRAITLPLLTTLTAYFLWRALSSSRLALYILAGVFLGLSIYTYQASRVFPVIFGVFWLYLAVIRSPLVTRSVWRKIGVFFAVAIVVAAPLIVYLTAINPSAEERIADLSGPLSQLQAGDPSAVIQSTLNTLGMFTLRGDAVPIYNVSGRPVFPEPIGAALFYLGLLICLRRWKQPAYALMLIWFAIGLAPAMVTPFSPNFVRSMAAWPVPFVFVSVAMNEIIRRVGEKANQRVGESADHPASLSSRRFMMGLCGIVLIANGFLTARDYFLEWPRGDYVRFWQQASWTQAVRAINANPATTPVVASGLSIQDLDPQTFDLLSVRADVKVKWADCRQAVLYPGGLDQRVSRYLSPPYFACDADLRSTYLPGITTILQPRWPGTQDVIFTLDQFERPSTVAELVLPQIKQPAAYIGTESFDPANPVKDLRPFTGGDLGGLVFYGTTISQTTLKSGASSYLDTFWMMRRAITPPLKIFVHVTAPDGQIVTQWDGLDVNIATLEPGDFFIQRHHLLMPADLPSGPYRISLGAYHPDSGARLTSQVDGRLIDSVVVGTLTVTK